MIPMPKPKQKQISSEDVARLQSVSRKIGLIDVRLKSLALGADGELMELFLLDQLEVNFETSFQKNPAENILAVKTNFLVTAEKTIHPATSCDQNEQTARIEIAVLFEISYQLDFSKIADDGGIELFTQINSPLHAWPYLRELVQSLTARMGIISITLPVYRAFEGEKHKFSRKFSKPKSKSTA
jgi:hypothetical protein